MSKSCIYENESRSTTKMMTQSWQRFGDFSNKNVVSYEADRRSNCTLLL